MPRIPCSIEQQKQALPCPCHCNATRQHRSSLPPSQPCRQVYDLLSPGFTGRCTAPLLVDKRARQAVCNESAIICSNLAELARPLGGAPAAVELRPPQLVGEIDRWNERIYETGEAPAGAASFTVVLCHCETCRPARRYLRQEQPTLPAELVVERPNRNGHKDSPPASAVNSSGSEWSCEYFCSVVLAPSRPDPPPHLQ